MKKAEFMKAWAVRREAALRKMYKGDPHGPACLAASLVDVPAEGQRLWRKYRKTLRTLAVAEYFPDNGGLQNEKT